MSDVPELGPPSNKNERGTVPKKTQKKAVVEVDYNMPKELATRTGKIAGEEAVGDPEAKGDEEADEEEVKQALSGPPPVNGDDIPLPWKGRLSYVCYFVL